MGIKRSPIDGDLFITATHLSAKFLRKRDYEDFLSSNLIYTILTLPYEEIGPVFKSAFPSGLDLVVTILNRLVWITKYLSLPSAQVEH